MPIAIELQRRTIELAKEQVNQPDISAFKMELAKWSCLNNETAIRSFINWHHKPWATTFSSLTTQFSFFEAEKTDTHMVLRALFPLEVQDGKVSSYLSVEDFVIT